MSTRQRILIVLGTRPEAIKLAPIVRAMSSSRLLEPVVISTGQHREMLDQMLSLLQLTPATDLALMRPRQSLAGLTARLVEAMSAVLREFCPAAVVVQGDTTSAFVSALAAFYDCVPVAHVEAGLRSGAIGSPFPEEANRRLVGQLASWHFAPTPRAADSLRREAIAADSVEVTGNTGIDNLFWALHEDKGTSAFTTAKRKVLVTLHRRENQGQTMRGIAEAVRRLALRPDVEVVLPMHKSPAVRDVIAPLLDDLHSVRLIEPLGYLDFTATMAASDLVLTDSGGVQEEAPSLGKPVLVLRENTERPEAIEAGVARLTGVDGELVFKHATELLDDADAYSAMARAVNPFGDGRAAARVVTRLEHDLT